MLIAKDQCFPYSTLHSHVLYSFHRMDACLSACKYNFVIASSRRTLWYAPQGAVGPGRSVLSETPRPSTNPAIINLTAFLWLGPHGFSLPTNQNENHRLVFCFVPHTLRRTGVAVLSVVLSQVFSEVVVSCSWKTDERTKIFRLISGLFSLKKKFERQKRLRSWTQSVSH
jgi:hypothetical protein